MHRAPRANAVASVMTCVVGFTALPTPVAAVDVVSRAAWKAKPANTTLMVPMTPREIIIHHTSVRQQPNISLERKMRGLQGFSMRTAKLGARTKRAWGDVPYHFYIGASGRIAEGRSLAFAGDTNTRYSVRNRIQIVLEGQFDVERPNQRQMAALKSLVASLSGRFGIAASRISSHNDHASTNCPGKNLKARIPEIRAAGGG